MQCEGPHEPPKWHTGSFDMIAGRVNVNRLRRENTHSLHNNATQQIPAPVSLVSAGCLQTFKGPGSRFSDTCLTATQKQASNSAREVYTLTSLSVEDLPSMMQPSGPNGLPPAYSGLYFLPSIDDHQQYNPIPNYSVELSPRFPYHALDNAAFSRNFDVQSSNVAITNDHIYRRPPLPPAPYTHALPTTVTDSSPSYVEDVVDDVTDVEVEDTKSEPYAQLIYRALLGAPGHMMVLKEIYEWFEKNTDKAKSGNSKGWQNSIRHNLSMNQGFRKVEQSSTTEEGKRGYVWVLEQSAIDAGGVQSTTRFRKSGGSPTIPRRTREPLAVHRSRVRKSTMRRPGVTLHRQTANTNSNEHLVVAPVNAEPTPEPEDYFQYNYQGNDFMVQRSSNTPGGNNVTMWNPQSNYNSPHTFAQPLEEHEFGHHGTGQQYIIPFGQFSHQQFTVPAEYGVAYDPFTPPSSVQSLAPASPHSYQSSVGSSPDYYGQDSLEAKGNLGDVLLLDKIKCEPNGHSITCPGPTCHF